MRSQEGSPLCASFGDTVTQLTPRSVSSLGAIVPLVSSPTSMPASERRSTGQPGDRCCVFSYPDYVDYRDRAAPALDIAAFAPMRVNARIARGGDSLDERVTALLASGNYFEVLKAAAIRGRTFDGTFDLPPESTTEPDAAGEVLNGDEFIMDVQGHLLDYDLNPATAGQPFFGDGFPQDVNAFGFERCQVAQPRAARLGAARALKSR